ncbi:MAG: lamin tail domain-containing protein, partial [Bacteroidota bacterium]
GTSASFTVVENSVITPVISGPLAYCEGTGGVTLDAGTYASYLWSTGETTQTITALAGTYSVSVVDANGCSGTSATVTVIENANPMPTISGPMTVCPGSMVTLDAGTYASYQWSTGETTQTIMVGVGTYTVTVTDANGCVGTSASFTVVQAASPILTALTPDICESAAASVDLTTFESAITSSTGVFSYSQPGPPMGINELFFSEYVEGSGFTKYVEIYNGTGSTVDLSDYEFRIFFNGSTTSTNQTLSGSLNDGEVLVLANPSATAYTGTVVNVSAVNFNGDDAIGLYNTATGTYADIFGHIGEDPGAQWVQGSFNTANATLVRNADVTAGVTSSSPGFPELGTEWTEFAQNTVSNLGSHTVNGGAPVVIADPTDVMIADGDVITVTFTAGTCPPASTTISFSVTPTVTNAVSETVCAADLPFLFGSQSLNMDGVYVETFIGPSGCDSVVTLTLDVVPAYNVTDIVTVCEDELPFIFGTQTLNTPGSYTEVFMTADGCDSTVMLTFNVSTLPVLADITPELCSSAASSVDLTSYESQITASTANLSYARPATGGISELFFSEYVEGSGFTKYVEIYNGTGSTVDLSDYEFRIFFNGSTTSTNQTLSGSLNDGEVLVLANPSATAYTGAVVNVSAVNFNGDDALGLYNTVSGTYVDIFGHIGEDPGAQWVQGSFNTANATLVRNADVTAGVTSSSAGFPELGTEWTEFSQNTVSNLGSHIANANMSSPIADPTDVAIADGDVILVTATNGACVASSSITFSVVASKTNTVMETVCANDLPFVFGTQMLTVDGVYVETFTTAAGCDSVVTLSFMVDPTTTAGANNSLTVCEGEIIDLTSLVTVAGGMFSDPSFSGGLSGASFNTTALLGVYPLVYTVSSTNTCPDASAVITIIVQENLDRSCVATNFGDDVPGGSFNNHAVYLYDFPDGSGGTLEPRFLWETTGSFKFFNDGTGTLTGTVVNASNPNVKFDVSFQIENRRDWTSWSGLGRGYKNDSQQNTVAVVEHVNWAYFEISAISSLTGSPGSVYDGDVLMLTHDPADYSLGGQLGIGANDKDNSYGFSAWFGWSGTLAGLSYSSHGDVNVDLNCNESPCSAYTNNMVVVAPKAILEGPYSTTDSRMSDDLRSLSYLPANEPYTALGYTHVGSTGGESMSATTMNVSGDDAVVDWVWVELRDATDPTIVVAAKAALIQRDGDIVDADGSSAVSFDGVAHATYYFAIKHRNHLGIMTQTPISLDGSALVLNFIDGSTPTYGTNAQNPIGSTGNYCMVSANVTGDKVIDAADRSLLWNERSTVGYKRSDATCDGATDAADRSAGWNNRSRVEQIPD